LGATAETEPDAHDTDTIGKKSVDFADDESEPLDGRGGRHVSNVAHMSTPPPPSRELMSDTNDADNSGAGDTEEAYETSTSREDNHEKSRGASRTKDEELDSGRAEAERSEEEPEEEEEVDPEIRRRMEIRERMAKMSGGMGLMGMFGPPGGMPTPGKKASGSGEGARDVSGTQIQPEATPRAPPVPVPGISNLKSPERMSTPAEEDSSTDEDMNQVTAQPQRHEAEQSDEEIAEPPRLPPRTSTDRALPPMPQGM
jgi:myosin tail region-interacting protein MTI1